MVRRFIPSLGVLGIVLVGCVDPPILVPSAGVQPVDFQGESCTAQNHLVYYSALGGAESVDVSVFDIDAAEGFQFLITCGTTTTNCGLDEPLQTCVARIEAAARRSDRESSDSGGGSGGYTPPGR